jgi:drug/metabolite transporter (DMT)-like permease
MPPLPSSGSWTATLAELGARQPLVLGILGNVSFALLGALIKWMRLDLEPLSLIAPWISMNAVAVGAWILWQHGPAGFRTSLLKVHLIRGVVMFLPFLGSIYALQHVPLSLHVTLTNTSPFFLTLIAGLWLKESVGPREWAALGLGFAGVLICVRPGVDGFNLFALAPVLMALAIATGSAFVRRYPQEATSRWVFFQECIAGGLGFVILLSIDGSLPQVEQLTPMLGMVLIDLIAMSSIYVALSHMEASRLSPWAYVQIPISAGLGWMIFEEVPGWSTGVGALLIISGGWLTWRRPR